jgi:hypothetical protein
MEFALDPDLELISEAVSSVCAGFSDEYWSTCDLLARREKAFATSCTGLTQNAFCWLAKRSGSVKSP